MSTRRLHRFTLCQKTDGTFQPLFERRVELRVVSFHSFPPMKQIPIHSVHSEPTQFCVDSDTNSHSHTVLASLTLLLDTRVLSNFILDAVKRKSWRARLGGGVVSQASRIFPRAHAR